VPKHLDDSRIPVLIERLRRLYAIREAETIEDRIAELEARVTELQVQSTMQGVLAQQGDRSLSEVVAELENLVTSLEQQQGFH
jgi:hypothetical protein